MVVAAAIAAAGIADCATFGKVGNGTLAGNLEPTVARNRASLTELLSASGGTYIARILADRDSTFERWPDHVSNPLRVWIDSSSALSGPQSGFPAAVREAFGEWDTTGIPLRFMYVARPGDADIRVRWTDHLDRKTGSTTWRTDRYGWLTGSDITLATHISDGHVLDSRGMRAIALHEVGHALGMSHSIDGHDIMAALVRVDGLSQTDRNTIKLLYSYQAGRVAN
ncbi:MAG TPA: matrixin family metalloprotease [Gemmatimonadaceae bacterium]|nr:matrixin family metalloprotease [Gemmatimonadaceae bacterium]